jgi:hypothetical protein
MEYAPYYVYALKDPTVSPVMPFYIGKGTGSRAWDHDLKPNRSRKGKHTCAPQESYPDVHLS